MRARVFLMVTILRRQRARVDRRKYVKKRKADQEWNGTCSSSAGCQATMTKADYYPKARKFGQISSRSC